MDDRLQSIRPRLQQLALLDPEFELGESSAFEHKYQLAPPLPEREVKEFEEKHQIVLPLDYRRFLLEVGSHGAGPHSGLKSLGGWPSREPGFLTSPFPLHDWLNLVDNPQGLSEAEVESDKWMKGTLVLADEGCGIYDLLVVSGDERGHVWIDDRSNQFGIYPVAPNRENFGESPGDTQLFTLAERERTSFLDWYEWWLDWSFEEVKLYY